MSLYDEFCNCRVLVSGDVMLDRYWHGTVTRMSPEAPVPIVRIDRIDDRPGGAANAALGLAALGVNTTLMGCLGNDEEGALLYRQTARSNLRWLTNAKMESARTITKIRVVNENRQMIRVDFEDSPEKSGRIDLSLYRAAMANMNAVVLSDYGKGALSRVEDLIDEARNAGKPVLVDPKNPDFSVYRNATIITPNREEFERAAGTCETESDLVERGLAMIEKYSFGALVITRGHEGMTVLERGERPLHLRAHAKEVFDVTGAGDTVIAAIAACTAMGMPLCDAASYANVAASVAVGKFGTSPVTTEEIKQATRGLSADETQYPAYLEPRKRAARHASRIRGAA